MSNPWLKFYPTDWRSDPRLRMCSMAARGLWIEMIALMHESSPYGHLLVSGHSPTDTQLAVLAGAPSEQVPDLIGELESAGVFSRTREGVIYSRKLTRMQKKAATARNNGKNGGNPTLKEQRENKASDNLKDKGKDKSQKLEARVQSSSDAYASDGETVDFAKAIFDRGVVFLRRHGMSDGSARSLVGKWRQSYSDQAIFQAFTEAKKAGVTDPRSYITAVLKGEANGNPASKNQARFDAFLAGARSTS